MSTMTTGTRMRPKHWNFSLSQTEALKELFDRVLDPVASGALVLPDGRALHVKPSSPADLATLPQAAMVCRQYLRLGDLDFALLNDPSSGGTTLSAITLVTAVRLPNFEDSDGCDLLIASRVRFEERWGSRSHLDEEGVRIPPTPLGSRGELNVDLLKAIGSHPLAPIGLEQTLVQEAQTLLEVARALKNCARDPGSELRKANFKRYLADSSSAFENLMSRLPLGATSVSTRLPSGELLKLGLEINESRIEFNFAGTDASSSIGLTDLATLSACIASVLSLFNLPAQQTIPINAGVFEHFHVSAPSKTLLGWKAPLGVFRGMHFGVAGVCSLVRQGFAKLNANFRSAKSADSDAHFELAFKDGPRLAGTIASGAAASTEHEGLSAFAIWDYSETNSVVAGADTIEAWEARAPLVVTAAGTRNGTGGKGRKKGGDGQLLAFSVSAAAEFSWILGAQSQKHDGLESGRAGSPAAIEIVRSSSGETEALTEAAGKVALSVGDEVRLYASGGGGFGAPDASTAES